MKAPMPMSLLVFTRNSAETLPRLLETTGWAAERVVVDMQSSDGTVELCQAAGCRVISIAPTFAVDAIRNDYLAELASEWTLVLDSDEHLSADAPEMLVELVERHGGAYDAFALPRYNSIAGQVVQGGLFYPDQQIRLFRKGNVRWRDGHHHPPEVVGGRLMVLKSPCVHIHHRNYPDIQSFVERQLRYAITDSYDPDPASFDFSDYVGQAYAAFAQRHDAGRDGELSTALATVLAWDRIMRGLIHWERTGRVAELGAAFSLPIAAQHYPAAERRRGRAEGRLRRLYLGLPEPLKGLIRRTRSSLMRLFGKA